MPAPTSGPTGRALYDRASSAFVHNMPLDTLCIVEAAIQRGLHRSSPQLAEQFLVLQLTALFTVYCPRDPAHIEARIQQWRQIGGAGASGRRSRRISGTYGGSSGKASVASSHEDPSTSVTSLASSTGSLSGSMGSMNGSASSIAPNDGDHLPVALHELLLASPPSFLGQVWTHSLRYFADVSAVQSVQSAVPPEKTERIAPSSDTLSSVLRLPVSALEAFVAGALKVDEELARETYGSVRPTRNVNKASRSDSSDEDTAPGLAAARAACEWALEATSPVSAEDIPLKDRAQLQHLYARVLRLYAVEILGNRKGEWEYAREVVRCAKSLALSHELAQEMQQREALFNDIQDAERAALTRSDRQEAAKEHARRLMQEQIDKRTASADAVAAAAMAAAGTSSAASDPSKSPTTNASSSSSSGRSTPASSLSPTHEKQHLLNGDGAYRGYSEAQATEATSRPRLAARSNSSERSKGTRSSADESSQGRKSHDAPFGAAHDGTLSTGGGRRPDEVVRSGTSLESLRNSLLAWLRSLGPAPAVLCTAIAVLLLLRRAISAGRGLGSRRPATATTQLAAGARRGPSNGAAHDHNASPSMMSFLWQKVTATLRM